MHVLWKEINISTIGDSTYYRKTQQYNNNFSKSSKKKERARIKEMEGGSRARKEGERERQETEGGCGYLLHLKTLEHKSRKTLSYQRNSRRTRNARIRKTKHSLKLHPV